MEGSRRGAPTGSPVVTNPNRDAKGRYATFWMGLASFGALLLLWFFVMGGFVGYGG